LYLPLRDDQGTLGVLLFEAERTDFATPAQRELAEILANQTTVALRNAELYHQVPLVDALGAIAAKKRALLAIPRRRVQLYGFAIALALAAATFVQWPLRVLGYDPTFRAAGYTEVRAFVPGIVDRVMVREGMPVAGGAPLAQLRDVELRAERESRAAEATVADRGAAVAASRGNAAEQRMHETMARALRQEVALLDEQLAATTLRAGASGIVLTQRPEERVGARLGAGDLFVTIGRTDSLVLDFGVHQRDIERVQVGQRVRVRVNALPQRTFEGRVIALGELPAAPSSRADVRFPVRAIIANGDSVLKPGMVAYAKVLTAPASFLTRVVRRPARWFRLWWWRIRP
jgi:multidrug resistance efflux pump